jgi:hypothetical protein
MGKYLITGRGGSGKSAICRELQRRGFPAYDADEVPGLCRWQDRNSGKFIPVDPAGDVDFSKVAWAWQDTVLRQLINTRVDIILCGSSSNQNEYQSLFDTIFVLMLDPQTHDHRLRTRDFEYGKHPDLRRRLVIHHQMFADKLIASGAMPINTLQPIKNTVDDIVSRCVFSEPNDGTS